METNEKPHPFRSLLMYMCVGEVFYLLFVILSPLPGFHLTSTPLVDTFPWTLFLSRKLVAITGDLLKQYNGFSFALLGIIFIGLFLTYAGACRRVLCSQVTEQYNRTYFYLILAGAALFGVTLLFQPMLFSDDVFTYIFSGRILAVYHANPLSTTPQQFTTDPYLFWTISGRGGPNIYGPLWLFICGLLAHISNTPVVSLFLFKGLALCAHLVNTGLIWVILGHIVPSRRVIGTLLYAWSPLALIELVSSGHSEGVLLTLLLAATVCFLFLLERRGGRSKRAFIGDEAGLGGEADAASRRPYERGIGQRGGRSKQTSLRDEGIWRIMMLVILGLAASINMVTLLIAPLYIWFEMRQRRIPRALLGFSWRFVLILAIEVLLMVPFWHGSNTFFSITSSVDMAHFVHAPVALFTLPLHFIYNIAFNILGRGLPPSILPDSSADITIRATAMVIFILIYANLFSQIRRSPRTPIGMRNRQHVDLQMMLPGFDVLLTSCSLAIFWYLILVSGWFWPWYILWVLWLVVLRPIDALTSAVLLLSCTALFIYALIGFSRNPLETYQSAIIFGIPVIYLLVVRKRQKQAEKQAERIHNSDVRRSETTQN